MELVDRYLNAVKALLPRNGRTDIVNELSANIQSHFEDRESELGRPLDDSEQGALLEGLGTPSEVAGRYLPRRQQLIAPALVPIYLRAIALALPIAAIGFLAVAAGMALFGRPGAGTAVSIVLAIPFELIFVLGAVTLVFLLISRSGTIDRWNPRVSQAQIDPLRVSRVQSIGSLAGAALNLAFWLAMPYWGAIFGNARALYLGDAWHAFYLPFVALALASVVLAAIDIIRPRRTKTRAVTGLAINAAAAIAFFLFLKSGLLVTVSPGAGPNSGYPELAELINRSIFWSPLTLLSWVVPSLAVFAFACYYQLRRFRGARA